MQLIDHPFIKPASIHTHEVLEGYGGEYLYLGCIRFVMQASDPFRTACGSPSCLCSRRSRRCVHQPVPPDVRHPAVGRPPVLPLPG